jgi:sugar phosphate isomerase/epimerase
MKLNVFKSLWGMTGTLEENIKRVAEAGYAGVETGAPAKEQAENFKRLLKEHKLDYIGMAFTGGDDHVASLKTQIDALKAFGPIKVTVHSARDGWPFDQQKKYFTEALEIERKSKVEINHETHRGRAMFTPWATAALLKEFPELHIAADYSHFCCVCESLLGDQTVNIALCCQRARHIHGRIGHEEGPQVNDPRAPEWEKHVAAHEGWWETIAKNRKKAKADVLTFTPEFGPPNYMPTLPHTRQAVADLWDVCLYMGNRFKKKFAEMK